MKRIALPLLAILIASFAYGQDCKFKIDEPDPITGEHHLRQDIMLKMTVFVGLEKKAGKLGFSAAVMVGGEQNFVVPVGTSFVLKLENGDTLSALSGNEVAPVSQIIGNSVFTMYGIGYEVDEKFMEALSSSTPTFIRVRLGSGRLIDANIKKGAAKKIMKYAGCLK